MKKTVLCLFIMGSALLYCLVKIMINDCLNPLCEVDHGKVTTEHTH